ncbi:MAG TPA: serine/threonine-protein kinase [Ktedonobacterales bacterium]
MGTHSGVLSGRELGGYRLLHQVGAGGAGVVYLAQRTDRPAELFAVKVIAPSSGDPHDTLRPRFLREAAAAKRLRHPRILPVLAVGEADYVLYMVLPFMPGGTLATRVGAFPRGMPLARVVTALGQLAEALDYAHSRGIVHRDIKPTNILLDADGALSLADFGIARVFADLSASQPGTPTTLTATGQVLGTPQYMAPEQVRSGPVGPAADIYALGVVLYQMVTGAPPFAAETPMALAMKQATEPPPPLRLQRPDLPVPAEAAILRALAKRPEDRFSSAGALLRAFAAGVDGQWDASLASMPDSADTRPASALVRPIPLATTVQDLSPRGLRAATTRPISSPWVGWGRAGATILLTLVLATMGYLGVTRLMGSLGKTATTALAPVFQPDQVYDYHDYALTQAKSNPGYGPGYTFTVALKSLSVSSADGGMSLIIEVDNFDHTYTADFALRTLANVSLVDDAGHRYVASVSTPNEVLVAPGQKVTAVVRFPALRPGVRSLDLTFNTDHQALEPRCARLLPTGTVTAC